MDFRSRNIQLILRIILLFGVITLINYVLFFTHFYISASLLCAFLILQLAELMYFLGSERQQLRRFFSALLNNDFTYHVPEKHLDMKQQQWQNMANTLMRKVQLLQHEKHEKHLLLQLITENAGAGILVFDEAGDIFLMNDEARNLFGSSYTHHISGLNNYAEKISEKFTNLPSGEKTVLRLARSSSLLQIMVKAKHFRQQEKLYTLISLQHIGAELDEKEINAWQKLTSVLSHEIMNSLTPVISLASSANNMLSQISVTPHLQEKMEDVKSAMAIIEKRSQAMLHFVQAYRKMNKIPLPELQNIHLQSIIDEAVKSLSEQAFRLNINIINHIKESQKMLSVIADPYLLHQVLLNILLNSIYALQGQENAVIEINASEENANFIMLMISDNGSGIPDEARDKIFIPFYSTKPEGSGVGLSISKQILYALGGDIYLLPKMLSNNKTTFIIKLKQ